MASHVLHQVLRSDRSDRQVLRKEGSYTINIFKGQWQKKRLVLLFALFCTSICEHWSLNFPVLFATENESLRVMNGYVYKPKLSNYISGFANCPFVWLVVNTYIPLHNDLPQKGYNVLAMYPVVSSSCRLSTKRDWSCLGNHKRQLKKSQPSTQRCQLGRDLKTQKTGGNSLLDCWQIFFAGPEDPLKPLTSWGCTRIRCITVAWLQAVWSLLGLSAQFIVALFGSTWRLQRDGT